MTISVTLNAWWIVGALMALGLGLMFLREGYPATRFTPPMMDGWQIFGGLLAVFALGAALSLWVLA